MAGIGKLREKLGLYLSTLSDSAQNLLLRTLERGKLEGTNDAASDLILAALQDILKENEPDIPLESHAQKEFFRQCRPFLVKVDHVSKTEACISPSSLNAIWLWIKRDIASEEQCQKLEQPVNGLSDKEILKLATSFRDEISPAIIKAIKKASSEIGGEQKLGNQLGGQLIYEDLVDVISSTDRMKMLKPVLARMPAEITTWTGPQGDEAYKLITRYMQQSPMTASWLFSCLSNRFSTQRLKVQLATKLAGSDDAVQVSATVYAPAVQQLIADMEAVLDQFKSRLTDRTDMLNCTQYLANWRDLAKGVEADLEIPVQSAWGKVIAKMKTDLSDILEGEIEATPGLIRKALRAPKQGNVETADENLLQDAMRAAELFHHAERMKDSLALNGPITRIRKELDQSFEILTTSLIERSRQASGDDAKACRILGDAAVVLAKHLFDDSYATAFRRQLKAAASVPEMRAAEA